MEGGEPIGILHLIISILDVTAVLSLVNCMDTHHISSELYHHQVFLLAITEVGCQRTPEETSFMIPLVEMGNSIVQMLTDLR